MTHVINRHHIQRVFHSLTYRFEDFSIDDFIHHIQTLRNRSILCVPYAFSPGISGAWVRGSRMDFIFYRSSTHRIHQNHVILHEVAHMLLEHPLRPIQGILPPELLDELPTPSGHLRTLEVNRAKDVYEQEAEYFVALVQKQVVLAERMVALTMGGSSIPALHPYVQGLPYDEARREPPR